MGVNGNFTIPRGLQHTTSRLFQTHWVSSHLYWLRWNLVDRLIGNIFCTSDHMWTFLDFDFVHFVQETGHQGQWMPTYLQRMSFLSQQSTNNWRSRPTSPETPGLSKGDAERDTNAEPACGVRFCCRHGESPQVTHTDNNTTIIESHTHTRIHTYIYVFNII